LISRLGWSRNLGAIRRDVAYAGIKHERQTLDVYAPTDGDNPSQAMFEFLDSIPRK
jgi:hypothetical protein